MSELEQTRTALRDQKSLLQHQISELEVRLSRLNESANAFRRTAQPQNQAAFAFSVQMLKLESMRQTLMSQLTDCHGRIAVIDRQMREVVSRILQVQQDIVKEQAAMRDAEVSFQTDRQQYSHKQRQELSKLEKRAKQERAQIEAPLSEVKRAEENLRDLVSDAMRRVELRREEALLEYSGLVKSIIAHRSEAVKMLGEQVMTKLDSLLSVFGQAEAHLESCLWPKSLFAACSSVTLPFWVAMYQATPTENWSILCLPPSTYDKGHRQFLFSSVSIHPQVDLADLFQQLVEQQKDGLLRYANERFAFLNGEHWLRQKLQQIETLVEEGWVGILLAAYMKYDLRRAVAKNQPNAEM